MQQVTPRRDGSQVTQCAAPPSLEMFSLAIPRTLPKGTTLEDLYVDFVKYICSTKNADVTIPASYDLMTLWNSSLASRPPFGLFTTAPLAALAIRILEKTPSAAATERAQSVMNDVVTRKKVLMSDVQHKARVILRFNNPARAKLLEKRAEKTRELAPREFKFVQSGVSFEFFKCPRAVSLNAKRLAKIRVRRQATTKSALQELRKARLLRQRKK
jgi:hypothetical protein